jgi:glucan-binding YG repeat protein
MSKKWFYRGILCMLLLALFAVPCSVNAATSSIQTAANAGQKNGLKYEKVNGSYCYRYYNNGKLLKKAWKRVDSNGYKYYFDKDGKAVTLSNKIGGKYYVFNKKGQLLEGKKTRVCKIGSDYYQVNSKGIGVKGWSSDKSYYYDVTGKMVKGVQVIVENKKDEFGLTYPVSTFYYFSNNGKYNKTKTSQVRKAATQGTDISVLQKLIGKPKKTKWYTYSCYGDGVDGIMTYDGFSFTVFKEKTSGKVVFVSL